MTGNRVFSPLAKIEQKGPDMPSLKIPGNGQHPEGTKLSFLTDMIVYAEIRLCWGKWKM